MLAMSECSISSQLLPNGEVQIAPGGIVGRNNQRIFRRSGIHPSNGLNTLLPVRDFLNASLISECDKSGGTPAMRQQFNGGLERRVFLPDNLVQLCRAHSRLLQLLERTARFHSLVLARIADQEHAVLKSEPGEKVAHLAGACETRFINKVKVLLSGAIIHLG